jgi:acyl carrier protein
MGAGVMSIADFLGLVRDVAGLELTDVGPETHLTDSGLDSLGLVLLLLHVEECGVPLPDELVDSWSTLGDVATQIQRWYAPAPAATSPPPIIDRTAARNDPLESLEVEGRHVVVVPLLPEHIPVLHRVAATGRSAFSWWPRGRTVSLAEFEDRLWHDAVLQVVVIDRATKQLLGLVRISDYAERDGHAQLSVLGALPGRTWLLEGAALAAHRAFTMWPLRKLYALVPAFNDHLVRPRRLLLRQEGCLVGHEYFDGLHHDLHIYALHRTDFMLWWEGPWGTPAGTHRGESSSRKRPPASPPRPEA